MTRRMLAFFTAAPLALAKRGPKRVGVWDTPQGQYVLRLRAELERLGHFDDLKEDWEAVERALAEGCVCFEVRSSRIERSTGKVFARIAPVGLEVRYPPAISSVDEVVYVETVPWGGR